MNKEISKDYALAKEVITYINDNYAENITQHDTAFRFHLSREYFSRLFKKTFGFNFTQYLVNYRLYKAFPDIVFGLFFEVYGELPMMFIGVVSSLALIVTYEKRHTYVDYTNAIGFGILGALNALMGKALLMNYLKLPPYMVVLIALIFVGLAIGFIKLINKRHYKVLQQVAKVGVLLSVLLILVINIIKIFWGRERFRHMVALYSSFTPWYLPQALTTNN